MAGFAATCARSRRAGRPKALDKSQVKAEILLEGFAIAPGRYGLLQLKEIETQPSNPYV